LTKGGSQSTVALASVRTDFWSRHLRVNGLELAWQAPQAPTVALTPNDAWRPARSVADRKDAPWPRSPPGRRADPDRWSAAPRAPCGWCLTSDELAAAVRVRAVLLTGQGSIIVILRQRPDRAPYRVLPGGAVEATDPSIQAALARELREELGAQAVTGPRLATFTAAMHDGTTGTQHLHLARLVASTRRRPPRRSTPTPQRAPTRPRNCRSGLPPSKRPTCCPTKPPTCSSTCSATANDPPYSTDTSRQPLGGWCFSLGDPGSGRITLM
jgi:ADP-ribose pyrophosphatase YjhB (NUDIX family)